MTKKMLAFMLFIAMSTLAISPTLVSAEMNSTETSNNSGSPREIDLVNITRWGGPEGTYPTSFNETRRPIAPFNVRKVYPDNKMSLPLYDEGKMRVYVLVDGAIYDGIKDCLQRYVDDIRVGGFSGMIFVGTWGTPEEVREFLQKGYSIDDLMGVLLIGDIPAAWYETSADNRYDDEEFPMDLFYMDLNGVWLDSDGDGMYDHHTGDVAPEIWVGRLDATTLSGDKITLYRNYFDKNHRYRTQELSLQKRALVYVDDPWYEWAETWNSDVGLLYDNTSLVKEKPATTATDYEDRLTDNYEWISVFAHSWPGGHHFEDDDWNPFNDYVFSSEIKKIDPHAFFYNLFACSACRYIERNYIGGWYIFVDTYGLAAVGSTKTGSMLKFEYFYNPLAQGENIGEAFEEWFTIEGVTSEHWHYGMVLLGDPTLTISPIEMDTTPPVVTITSPKNGSVVDTEYVMMKGFATDDVGIVRVCSKHESQSSVIGFCGPDFNATSNVSISWAVELEEGVNTMTWTAYDEANNSGNASVTVIYEKSESTPTVSIATDKKEYRSGDVMNVTSRLENPTETTQQVIFALDLIFTDTGYRREIMWKEITLTEGYATAFSKSLHIGYLAPMEFNASWHVALLDKTTLRILSEDTASWKYVPSKRVYDKTMPTEAEIVREITKEIERVKLPS